MSHTKKEIERGNHKRKREANKEVEQPNTSGLNSAKVPVPEIQISKLRKRNTTIVHEFPANMQDRANVGHQLAGLAKRRQICQRFANVANVLPTSLQTP